MTEWLIRHAAKALALHLTLGALLTGGWLSSSEAKQLTFAPASGSLSSHFGWRDDPMNGSRRFHSGIDIAAAYGTPIYATQAGQVAYAASYGGYGNVVVLDHGNGLYTLFGHTSKMLVKRGDIVSQGQVIAEVGSSGRSTGPHLHFEVHHNRQYVNPIQYLTTLSAPGMVALSAPTPPAARNQSVGGVEIVSPNQQAPTPPAPKAAQKRWKHQVEVVRGEDVEVVRF